MISRIKCITISLTLMLAASASFADTISTPLQIYTGHTSSVFCVAFSPDGSQILTGSVDDTAKLWNKSSGLEIRSFIGHTDWVHVAKFSQDGTQVVTGSYDHTAKLWDKEIGTETRSFIGHTDIVWDVSFSPDGTEIGRASCRERV